MDLLWYIKGIAMAWKKGVIEHYVWFQTNPKKVIDRQACLFVTFLSFRIIRIIRKMKRNAVKV